MEFFIFYLFWGSMLISAVYCKIKSIIKKKNIAIDALRKIASTDYDMNKLVVIAIQALKDIDKLK